MAKKGDVNWFMIMLVMGVIALVIIVIMLQQQSSRGVSGYEQFRNQTTLESLNRCGNIVLGRFCSANGNCPDGSKPVSGFTGCNGSACCQRI